MIFRLLLLMIGVPLVELVLLLWLADRTSLGFTLGVVILTGIAGTILARAAGLRAWRRFRAAVAEGRMPSEEIQHGLVIAFAAALLLTPGLLTDAVGLALLVGPVRDAFLGFLLRRYRDRFRIHTHISRDLHRRDFGTIDADRVSRLEEDEP